MEANLDLPVERIKGASERILKPLHHLGIRTVRDLLFTIPFRYDDFSHTVAIADAKPDETATVRGNIIAMNSARTWKKKMHVTEATIADASGSMKAVWYNQPFLARTLAVGKTVNLSGKIDANRVMQNPAYEVVGAKDDMTHTGRLVPVYRETRGLTSRWLRYLIKNALPLAVHLDDILPPDMLKRQGLPSLRDAIPHIHFPRTKHEAEQAKKRLAFEELFLFQMLMLEARANIKRAQATSVAFDLAFVKDFVGKLPFRLTDAQRAAAWEIIQDMEKPSPMNRLLEGDVGSGKTVVAAIAASNAAMQGWQCAFMAPTEILARQHFETFSKMCGHFPIRIGLLTGSGAWLFDADLQTSYKVPKAEIAKKVADGSLHILIGTHALIAHRGQTRTGTRTNADSSGVVFPKLALVVLDEQHRFGVQQRAKLVARGQTQTDARTDADYETPTNTDESQTNADFLYEDVTYKIRAALFKVKKELGLGHKEVAYQKALEMEFKTEGLVFEKEKSIAINYQQKKIALYRPDFIIENKVIVEIKALPYIGVIEERQVWNYLKGSLYKLALLVNFSSENVQIKRIIYDTARLRRSASDLRSSATVPHLLSMTATPIPRTLALALYGDLDISLLAEMPENRKKIETSVVAENSRAQAYAFMRRQVKQGRQAFIICPRIEDSQTNADLTQTNADYFRFRPNQHVNSRRSALLEVKTVKAEYERLSKNVFPDLRIAMLHGKMKPKEKELVMKDFKAAKTDILISTSVVEVGVDIPNASIMAIEGAERFGLAQLHQFRGRVGRAEHQSYCFLFTQSDAQEENKRLAAMVTCNDGFILAEKDLKIRGPGDLLGGRQSGLPDLVMASLTDAALIKSAREEASGLLARDPRLLKSPKLRERLAKFNAQIHFE